MTHDPREEGRSHIHKKALTSAGQPAFFLSLTSILRAPRCSYQVRPVAPVAQGQARMGGTAVRRTRVPPIQCQGAGQGQVLNLSGRSSCET